MKYRKLVVLPAVVLASCGTLLTQLTDTNPEDCSGMGTLPSVYSGVVFDVKGALHYECRKGKCEFFTPGPSNNVELFLLLDVPLSLTLDTIVLPYTLYRQLRHGSICPARVAAAPPLECSAPAPARRAAQP